MMYKDNDYGDFEIDIDADANDKIKLKIMAIQQSNDLNTIDLKFEERPIKMKSINLAQAQEKFDIWKNVSRLAVYLMSDYDFFSNVQFKDAFKSQLYSTAMNDLGFKKLNNMWTSVCKPDVDIVSNYIFKYCFYSYVVQSKKSYEPRNPSKNNFPRDTKQNNLNYEPSIAHSTISKCIYCDNCILPHENKCNLCGGPPVSNALKSNKIQDYHNENTHIKKPVIGRCVENPGTSYHPMHVEPRSSTSVQPGYRAESNFSSDNPKKIDSADNDTKQYDILINNMDKWNCSACSYNNTFNLGCCAICFSNRDEFGSWLCKECTFINKVRDSKCVACQFENKLITSSIKNPTNEDKEKSTSKYPGGDQKNYDVYNNKPRANSHAPYDESAFSNTKPNSVTERKQFRSVDSNQMRDDEPEFLNNSRNLKKTAPGEILKCWNLRCRQPLDDHSEFCKHCFLNRRGNYDRAQHRTKDQIRHIWICRKCNKYNDIYKENCTCNN